MSVAKLFIAPQSLLPSWAWPAKLGRRRCTLGLCLFLSQAAYGQHLPAHCAGAKTLLSCTTEKGRQLLLCDKGEKIEYQLERHSRQNLHISVPRSRAYQQQDRITGRLRYSVNLIDGGSLYRVFHYPSFGSSQIETGVQIEINAQAINTIHCNPKRPVINVLPASALNASN